MPTLSDFIVIGVCSAILVCVVWLRSRTEQADAKKREAAHED